MQESRTIFFLLAEFGTGHIMLDRCAHHFGFSADEAKRAATRQSLPVPAFRLGSQKSPWLISAIDLAHYIDSQREAAGRDWSKINSAST
jgi:hypothetical protein